MVFAISLNTIQFNVVLRELNKCVFPVYCILASEYNVSSDYFVCVCVCVVVYIVTPSKRNKVATMDKRTTT